MAVPSFTLIYFFYTQLPVIILALPPDGITRTSYNCSYSFLVFCFFIFTEYRAIKNRKNGLKASRKQKIDGIKLGLFGVLISHIIQQSASCFLIYYADSKNNFEVLISTYLICTSGLASVLFAYPLRLYSNSFFHVTDLLDGYSFVAFFLLFFYIAIAELKFHAAIYAYILLYFLTLKALCITFLDPNGIRFITEKNVFVSCKTWKGREYRGRLTNYKTGLVISLDDVKIKKDGKWIKQSEYFISLVYINLRSIERIPCLHESGTCNCYMKEIPKKANFNQNQKVFPTSQPIPPLGSNSQNNSAFTSVQIMRYV